MVAKEKLKVKPLLILWAKYDIATLYLFVVYFDQQMHACACVRMVENDQKHSKMSKKSIFFIISTRSSRKARQEKQKKIVFLREPLVCIFFIILACVRWLKYTAPLAKMFSCPRFLNLHDATSQLWEFI